MIIVKDITVGSTAQQYLKIKHHLKHLTISHDNKLIGITKDNRLIISKDLSMLLSTNQQIKLTYSSLLKNHKVTHLSVSTLYTCAVTD